ncbi:MAG: hypothetical protein AAGJ31_12280 [Verrucomicrobiota bacterium]
MTTRTLKKNTTPRKDSVLPLPVPSVAERRSRFANVHDTAARGADPHERRSEFTSLVEATARD